MVRYIKNDELYHSGVKGQKWYHRRYQYEDGKYTPLGRLHYGIGVDKSKMSGVEKLGAYKDATLGTLAGYGLIRYKKTTEQIKGDSKLTKAMKRQALADKKRADEAFASRIKAKEEKARKKAEEIAEKTKKRIEERKAQEEKAREAREKNIKENQERKQKYDENVKRVTEEAQKKLDESRSEKNVDKAKQNRWEDFTDKDLENYVNRANLEAKATEAMLLKMDAPRKVIDEIAKYGSTAVNAYNQYRNVLGTVKSLKRTVVPKTYTDIVRDRTFDYMKATFGDTPNAAQFDKQTLQDWIDIIEKIDKLDPH